MNYMVVEPLEDSLYQGITLDLKIEKETKRVSLDLIYLEETDRWYVSLIDFQTNNAYLRNVPLLSSSIKNPNNLWLPFKHKRIGSLYCFPASDNTSTENPSKDNLSEFVIVWSDGIGE